MSKVFSQTKLDQMKVVRKYLLILSVLATVGSIVMLILYNFQPACNLTVKGTDKFGQGLDYPGWQMIYYGIGRQYIPGYYEFGFNIWTCLGMFVPFLALIICSIMYRQGKNKRKAILEFIMAGTLIVGSLLLVTCTKTAVLVASNKGMNSFKDSYLLPAIEAGTFKVLAFPKIVFVVCFIAAGIKIINACFLLYQKSYAKRKG